MKIQTLRLIGHPLLACLIGIYCVYQGTISIQGERGLRGSLGRTVHFTGFNLTLFSLILLIGGIGAITYALCKVIFDFSPNSRLIISIGLYSQMVMGIAIVTVAALHFVNVLLYH